MEGTLKKIPVRHLSIRTMSNGAINRNEAIEADGWIKKKRTWSLDKAVIAIYVHSICLQLYLENDKIFIKIKSTWNVYTLSWPKRLLIK